MRWVFKNPGFLNPDHGHIKQSLRFITNHSCNSRMNYGCADFKFVKFTRSQRQYCTWFLFHSHSKLGRSPTVNTSEATALWHYTDLYYYYFIIVSAYRYIAITNLPIIAVFVEYLRQFLIDFNQIYRHSSVP